MRKYKIANKTLDIIQLISLASLERQKEQRIAFILSDVFERSCAFFDCETILAPYKGEDLSFFEDENEVAVAAWCQKNRKPCGRGTDTLRNAKAIYFPIETATELTVVGFSCVNGKMTITDRMIFSQIESTLRAIL